MNSSNTQYPHPMLYTPASPTSRVQVLARTQPSEARSTLSLVGWVGGAPVSVPAGLLWGCTPHWELVGARGAEVQVWNELNLTGQILEGWSLQATAVGPAWRPAVEVVSVWSLNHGDWCFPLTSKSLNLPFGSPPLLSLHCLNLWEMFPWILCHPRPGYDPVMRRTLHSKHPITSTALSV